MLFTSEQVAGIRDGRITLTFRRWKRPQARAGRFQRTAAGMIKIDSVDVVLARQISDQDARGAGFDSRAALLDWIEGDEHVYRVAFHREGEDKRAVLQQTLPSRAELNDLHQRLARMDDGSPRGAWTLETLKRIRANPGLRAANLAAGVGVDTQVFKKDVRRLKALGLTISLEVGYRLSPRGEAALDYLLSRRTTMAQPASPG
ncbi:MAG TPA: hypothetical protein VFO84_08010 [Dehalococcoidia bacterium]|nr:hypothetical protein [Dehalococcoidia bacterium]